MNDVPLFSIVVFSIVVFFSTNLAVWRIYVQHQIDEEKLFKPLLMRFTLAARLSAVCLLCATIALYLPYMDIAQETSAVRQAELEEFYSALVYWFGLSAWGSIWGYKKLQASGRSFFKFAAVRLVTASTLFLGVFTLTGLLFSQLQFFYYTFSLNYAVPPYITAAPLFAQYWAQNRFLKKWISQILLAVTIKNTFFSAHMVPLEAAQAIFPPIHLVLTIIGVIYLILQYWSENCFINQIALKNVTVTAFAYYARLGANTRGLLYRLVENYRLKIAQQDRWNATLALATRSSRTDIIDTLLALTKNEPDALKAMLNYTIEDGHTALTLAAQYGYTDCARSLLQAATDAPPVLSMMLEHTTQENLTALGLAARNQRTETICLLLSYGADWEASGIPQEEQLRYKNDATYQPCRQLGM